jgi:ABC-type sugar transport system ATPase subunit
MNNSLLKIDSISKVFPGVKALDRVSFEVKHGEVHSIVGENGAGKSTLMNILSGVYTPDEGKVHFNNKDVRFVDPRQAQEAGIAMIHQELSLATNLSVMENIYIGRLKKNKLGFIDYKYMYQKCQNELKEAGIHNISPKQLVEDLSLSQMQMIEIVKALSLKAKLLIMDEPTASLTQKETETLMDIIKSLKNKGVSILYISHKMDEIFSITDTITVLRDGTYIKTIPTKNTTSQEIISLMVGREFKEVIKKEQFSKNPEHSKEPILKVENFCVGNRVKDVNFSLYKGEILALTGLVGAGRTELVQGIFGLEKGVKGDLFIDGEKLKIKSPVDAIKLGIGLVPEGRKSQGLLMEMTVRENITISKLNSKSFQFFINKKHEIEDAQNYVNSLSIKTPSIEQEVQYLSGGNQQKSIFSRWLLNKPKILILDEPTHGVDIGAKGEIYKIIHNLAKENVAIILISSELPEVLTMADRILVMNNGRVTKELDIEEANQERIMEYAI